MLPGLETATLAPGPVAVAVAGLVDDAGGPAWTRDPLRLAMVKTCAGNVDRAEREGSSWAVANAVRALAALLESFTPAGVMQAPAAGDDDNGLTSFLDALTAEAAGLDAIAAGEQ